MSQDACGRVFYSNQFNITMKPSAKRPPIVANSMGPLTVYQNQKHLFRIPTDLFIDQDDNDLTYSLSLAV